MSTITIVALIGLVAGVVLLPSVSLFALWIVVLGFVILVFGNLLARLYRPGSTD